jgi:hypothetical protein
MAEAELLSLVFLILINLGILVSLLVDWDQEVSSVPALVPFAYFGSLWAALKVVRPQISRGEKLLCILCDLCLNLLLPGVISAGLYWFVLRKSVLCDASPPPEVACQHLSCAVRQFWDTMKELGRLWWEHLDGHQVPMLAGSTDGLGRILRFFWTVALTALFVWYLGANSQLLLGSCMIMDMLAVGGLGIRAVLGQIALPRTPVWLTPWVSWVLQKVWLRLWPLVLLGFVIGGCWAVEKLREFCLRHGVRNAADRDRDRDQDPDPNENEKENENEDECDDGFELRSQSRRCCKCGDRKAEVTLGWW